MRVQLYWKKEFSYRLIYIENSELKLLEDGWLPKLVASLGKEKVYFVGLDEKERPIIEMSISLFEKLKNELEFIGHCENLRRIKFVRQGQIILDYLCNSKYNLIDNDLDNEN